MNFVKIAVAVLIITAGLAGSYLIVQNSLPQIGENQNFSQEVKEKIKELVKENPLQWLEKSATTTYPGLGSLNQKNLNSDKTGSANLTDLISQSMFKGMQKLDQSGKNPFENFDPNDKESQKMIQEALAGLQDPSLFFNVSINAEDIKISQDNSSEAKKRYLTETAKIILNNSNSNYRNPQKALDNFADNFDTSGVKNIADAYLKILDGFLDIKTPSVYLDIHKRYLIIAKKLGIAYSGIQNFQNDPIKAYLFMQSVPELIKIETAIKQEYYQKSLL